MTCGDAVERILVSDWALSLINVSPGPLKRAVHPQSLLSAFVLSSFRVPREGHSEINMNLKKNTFNDLIPCCSYSNWLLWSLS